MILEPRFLEKPAFAVEQSRNAARKMAEESHNVTVYSTESGG